MNKRRVLAVDLGGTSIKMAVVADDGMIEHNWNILTNKVDGGSRIIPDIIQSAKANTDINTLEAVGIGVAGNVDYFSQSVHGAYNLNWPNIVQVGDEVGNGLALPVIVENDANVAALGEQWMGVSKNTSDSILITLGTGIGSGIIINNDLVRGTSGASGEIGHIIVDEDGLLCTCGHKGCLETVASATGIVNLANQVLASGKYSDSKLNSEIALNSKLIFDYAAKGDYGAKAIVDKTCKHLGKASAVVANLLNPEMIVFGGGVSKAGEALRLGIEGYYHKFVFTENDQTTKICLATTGNNAGILGAAKLVFDVLTK